MMSPPVEPKASGGKIAYWLAAETNGWNPSASQWASSGHEVARSMFDTLSAYDEESKMLTRLQKGHPIDDLQPVIPATET